jgi:NAD(P)-dependent dehydrogenase (short-subunit alcohol dehydrogenase family)
MPWTLNNIPDQHGRTVIVTGANTGLGFETAQALASKGAAVTIASRNVEKGNAAAERINAQSPDAPATFVRLDLADLESVRAFAALFAENHSALDLLVLNAGVMIPPESTTAQGFELQIGVNHLGHFALTALLLPLLEATEDARVVVVSSSAASSGEIDFEDLNWRTRDYKPWPAYAQSKLANQLFARELQRRLDASGSGVRATAAHPGWVKTDLQRSSRLVSLATAVVGAHASQGALPTLRAATDPDITGGEYFGPTGFMQMRGHPEEISMVNNAENTEDAARLWDISEDLTGIEYTFT